MRFRIKYKDLVCELIEPPMDKNLHKGIIVFSGLPNQPRNEDFAENLSNEGFYVLQPRYIGSWESDGNFSIENCIKTVVLAQELLFSGKAIECYDKKRIKWKINDSYILGSSFAPAIFLSAIKFLKINNFIGICPLTNLTKHNSNPNLPEQDLENLHGFLKRGFKNSFRNFKKEDWLKFIRGESIANPINYVKELKDKNILLIHGDNDTTINISRTKEYYEKIRDKNKVKFETLKNIGHGKECKKASFEIILNWLKQK